MMQIGIIGSGPVGMTAALLLARAGHRVVLVDRDPGPIDGRPWERVGVMQFHLPHGFRAQSGRLLTDRLPDVYAALIAAGAGAVAAEGAPPDTAWLQVRRAVFERVLWDRTSVEPGVERRTGHVDEIVVENGRAVGLSVDSAFVAADLVVDASGRAGRITGVARASERVECGMAYASRQYRLRPGAEPGPINGGPGWIGFHRGFVVLLFQHDDRVFSVLFVRPSHDESLARLRHTESFEAACRVVPGLDAWTDPARSEPIDVVRAGAGLANTYAGQPSDVARVVAIGDAFCTTNPQGGRGVSLGLQSAAALVDLLAAVGPDEVTGALEEWGARELRPWYDDHVVWDASVLAQWAGRPVEVDGPIGLESLVAAAGEVHPEWWPLLRQFFGMEVQPPALDALRAQVRTMVRDGWQPAEPAGPTRDELAALIEADLAPVRVPAGV